MDCFETYCEAPDTTEMFYERLRQYNEFFDIYRYPPQRRETHGDGATARSFLSLDFLSFQRPPTDSHDKARR